MSNNQIKTSLIGGLAAMLALAACSGGGGVGNSSPSPASTANTDIVRSDDGVFLGSGWNPPEHYQNLTFRWVSNNAEITACPDVNDRSLAINVEPGPGVGNRAFVLNVVGNHGDRATATVKGLQYVRVKIPASVPAETFMLYTQSKNLPTPNDKRVLNFRVLDVVMGSSAGDCKREIVNDNSPIQIGAHWYAYETFNGQNFRWASNDAVFKVTAPQPKPFDIEVAVEPGPSLGRAPLSLAIKNGQGKIVVQGKPSTSRGYVDFPMRPTAAGTVLMLSTPSKNVPPPHDKRTLNFRVFNIKIKPQA